MLSLEETYFFTFVKLMNILQKWDGIFSPLFI